MTSHSRHVSSWLRFDGVEESQRSRGGSSPAEGSDAPRGAALPGATAPVRVPDTLRNLYERYCEHEARELLHLMSREAFRALYRKARRLAGERDPELAGALSEGGPMELAGRFARRLMPLPPYEIWMRSYLDNRPAFLERLGIESAPDREEPVTVSVRPVGDGWYAALRVHRSTDGWGGSIRFHRTEGARAWTTSAVFRGEGVDDIQNRFRSFDDNTLRAFLRSVLP